MSAQSVHDFKVVLCSDVMFNNIYDYNLNTMMTCHNVKTIIKRIMQTDVLLSLLDYILSLDATNHDNITASYFPWQQIVHDGREGVRLQKSSKLRHVPTTLLSKCLKYSESEHVRNHGLLI